MKRFVFRVKLKGGLLILIWVPITWNGKHDCEGWARDFWSSSPYGRSRFQNPEELHNDFYGLFFFFVNLVTFKPSYCTYTVNLNSFSIESTGVRMNVERPIVSLIFLHLDASLGLITTRNKLVSLFLSLPLPPCIESSSLPPSFPSFFAFD